MFDSQTILFTKMEMESKRNLNFFFSHPLLLFFSIITSPYLLQICSSQDTITPTQSIIGDQTISSTGDNFLLGFFTPGNSTYRYMGIWYKKVSPHLYVWVSNTDTPLPSSSTAVLRFGEDGNLNLVDNTTGKIYWSTNTTVGSRSDANTTKAVLLDSGNLVLTRTINNTETQVWQSFDHPSDVLIPGMKIGLNLKTGQEWYLKSWVDISNPAFGGFVLALDNSSLNQIVSKRGALHWRSGPWNGEGFDGVVEMKTNKNMYNYSLVRDGDGVYFSFSTYDPSVISMMIFDSNGKILQLTWNKEIGHWGPVWAHPNSNQCEVYDLCGEFGSCKAGPSCNCLKGFEPLSPKNWSSNDWSGGCVRRTALICGKVDKFLKVGGMRLPDKSVGVGGSSVGECQSKCLGNCTCTAYSYLGLNQCMVWSGGLVDLEQVGSNGHDLYIRLDASELKGTKRWVLALIIVAATVGVILLFGISIFVWRLKAKQRGLWKKPMATPSDSKDANKLRDDDENSGAELPLFDFATIAAATENFSNANKLGEGGFGPVYKGKLPDGQEIAVKRLARSSGQGSEEFKNEVVLLSKLQHRNLVRVLGCCIQGEEKILIYEFMTNKSLDSFIFDPTKRAILDWAKSFRIVEGIAHGLLYLHQYSRLRIIHRDLKASNILLDGEMNPKISDFGMARIFGGNQTQANTNRVVGTYGYMAPEYAMDGQFSVKSDIFSFGVILLEIISGKKNTGFQHEETSSLIAYAWQLWKAGRSSELLDPSLGDSCPTHEVLRCIHVGLLCVQEEAGDRPTMSTVVMMLGSDATTLPEPKKPGFSMGKITNTTDSTGGTSRSINSVTITMIEGR